MNIPARLVRAVVQDIPGLRPEPTPAAQRTRDLILKAAVNTFAALGRRNLTMIALAEGIWMSRARIREHFLDLDCLLAEILTAHLQGLARALKAAPNTPTHRRAAYYAYTRGPSGGLAKEHALFVTERQYLPNDLLPAIEDAHRRLGPMLCPENPDAVLKALDDPTYRLATIERARAGNPAPRPKPAPAIQPARLQGPLSPKPAHTLPPFQNRFTAREPPPAFTGAPMPPRSREALLSSAIAPPDPVPTG
jgi:hypothetical protein